MIIFCAIFSWVLFFYITFLYSCVLYFSLPGLDWAEYGAMGVLFLCASTMATMAIHVTVWVQEELRKAREKKGIALARELSGEFLELSD